MLAVSCPSCQTQVFLECTCPPDFVKTAGFHTPGCTHENVDRMVRCPPDAPDCCHIDHDHGVAANACPRGHDDEPCPEPRTCRAWRGAIISAAHPTAAGVLRVAFAGREIDIPASADLPDCPGGHCHKLIKACALCRPLMITVMPGTTVAMAGAGA